MQFTGEVTSVIVENMIGLYWTMIGRLRPLSESRLRQQAGIEKISDTCKKDILVQGVRNNLVNIDNTVFIREISL